MSQKRKKPPQKKIDSTRILEREHDFLSALLSTSSSLVVSLNRRGQIVLFNKECERLTGYSFGEVKGRTIWDLFLVPEEVEGVKAVFAQLSSGQFPNQHRNFWMTKEGDRHLIQWSNTALLDDSGKVEFVIGTGVDISERAQASDSLSMMLERLRNFIEHSPTVIYIKDKKNRHIYGNRALLESFDISKEEFFGTTSHNFFSREMANQLENWDEKVRTEQVPLKISEYTSKYKGEIIWWREIKFPLSGYLGEKLVGGIAMEITELKETESKLQKAFDEIQQLKDRLQADNLYLKEEIKLTQNFESIIGDSNELLYVLHKIEQVAPTDTTILIEGETGTGKELVARAIHSTSMRKDRPLIKVDCTRLPSSLIESELFGHEKGAFTGAVSKRTGRFEIADGSTIFLDEIAELPLDLQTRFLQVLESGEFERLGSSRTIKSDVRVIVASNRNLNEEVEQGRFREDLYYRLNVFPITVPPLRQRKDDIPLLVKTFTQRYCKKLGKTIESIPRRTMEALCTYSWPGNIRELENVIERGVLTSQGKTLQIELPSSWAAVVEEGKTLEEVERDYIIKVLDAKNWRVSGPSGAALALGLHPETLRSRMRKLRIKKPTST